MNFYILTLFPEMVMSGLDTSILKRARDKSLIDFEAVNIRDYANNKHNRVDDYTYGGGAGMLMQAQPVYDAYMAVKEKISLKKCDSIKSDANSVIENRVPRVIYVTPQGETFTQNKARELAQEENLIFLCGHYEGIDERVLESIVTDNISIGDYVLTGGELPAMVMIDAISRLIPGVLNNEVSAVTESFEEGLLEYPQYSRPEVWQDKKVPEILLSGNHAKIEEYHLYEAIRRTRERRPDMYEAYKAKMIEEEKALKPKKRKITHMIEEIEKSE